VVDVASPAREEQMIEVDKVLAEIGASEVPQLLVMNKIDAAGMAPGMERDEYGKIYKVWVSARDGAGMEFIRQALIELHQTQTQSTPPELAAVEFSE
jgi:GTP-binding protein HflX